MLCSKINVQSKIIYQLKLKAFKLSMTLQRHKTNIADKTEMNYLPQLFILSSPR